MNRFLNNVVVVAALTVLMILPLSAAGAAEDGSQPHAAQVTLRATGLSWQPDIDFQSAVLTVLGPADVMVRKEFAAGEAVEFSLADVSSGGLPDGQYAWELVFSPRLSSGQKDLLRTARESEDAEAIDTLKRDGKLPVEMAPISGYFRVAAGTVISADRTEAPQRAADRRITPETESAGGSDSDAPLAVKDQVINDDLIVTGSECIGFDCVNGESFGFDTLRLKENNLRIKFQDTSNSASFPSNDWQLTANDTSNGGADKFSIDDIDGGRTPFTIRAGAPSNSLFVDASGRVGFGTATPVTSLHAANGNTPTLRLEQNGSSGFTAQTWDVAANEANFFIRDATNGSTLPFRIRPGAKTSSIDISAAGNVGVGSSSPDTKLHVLNGDIRIEKTNATATDHSSLYLERSGATAPSEFVIRSNASTGALEIKDVIAATTALKFQPGAANNSIVVASAVGGQVRVGIGDTTPSGTLDVAGTIFLSGAQIHPDFVFEPGYQIESIDEHAAFMWSNKHLPAMGPGEYDENGMARFELGKHQVGLLEELEKAHIYIEQLNNRNDKLETRNEQLESEHEILRLRVAEIENALKAIENRLARE